jgi:hypothetical protein
MLHTALMITYDQVDWFGDKGRVALLKLGPDTRKSLSELCRTLQQATTLPRSLLTLYLTL